MATVFLTCGKICSGKTTYARQLKMEHQAVILSIDEITLALFGQDAGEKMDEYVQKAQNYLYQKSLDIIAAGVNVVLDWGFWTRKEREHAKRFYTSHHASYEFHYLNVGEEEWKKRLAKRNVEVQNRETDAYFVDDGLLKKFDSIFQMPDRKEMDVWIEN